LSFKVFPRPRATTTLEFSLPTVSAAIEAASFLNRGPLDLEALDILPGGDLLVRLGGHPDALDARAERLGAQVQAPARRYSGDAERVLWTDAAELSWIPAGNAIVRVRLTARTAAALDLAMTRASATVRYGLGANVGWVAWPAGTPLDQLDAVLRSLELSGVVLTGPAARPLLGLERGGAFGARVRSALDPFARFLGD
jgi:glycolate oxidase FAD binding subunit